MKYYYIINGVLSESTEPFKQDVGAVYLTPIEYRFAQIINDNPIMSIERLTQSLQNTYRLVHLGDNAPAEKGYTKTA